MSDTGQKPAAEDVALAALWGNLDLAVAALTEARTMAQFCRPGLHGRIERLALELDEVSAEIAGDADEALFRLGPDDAPPTPNPHAHTEDVLDARD